LSVFTFWPVLWHEPFQHFADAFHEMKTFPWYGDVLYRGKYISGEKLPWHYVPVWMSISIPPLYVLLFLSGLAGLLLFFVRNKFNVRAISPFYLIGLGLFFIPLLSVIYFHSVIYDGWRHLYFVYPAIIIVAIFPLERIFGNSYSQTVKRISAVVVLAYFALIIFRMAEMHPYQQVYFNFLAGTDQEKIKSRYDYDYWGLSYKKLLESILAQDSSNSIRVWPENLAGLNASLIFPDSVRTRLSFVDKPELTDYYITNFRSELRFRSSAPVAASEVLNGAALSSAFRLKDQSIRALSQQTEIGSYILESGSWRISNPEANGVAHYIDEVDSAREFSATLNMPVIYNSDTSLSHYVQANFRMKAGKSDWFKLVFSMADSTGKNYHWNGIPFSSPHPGNWCARSYIFLIPKALSPRDKMSVYVWNEQKKHLLLDQFSVNVFTLSAGVARNIH